MSFPFLNEDNSVRPNVCRLQKLLLIPTETAHLYEYVQAEVFTNSLKIDFRLNSPSLHEKKNEKFLLK